MDDTLLGLTEYEGKVYRALLQEPGATAYRLGKRSGVPLSRVYEIVERLADKGAAIREDGEPARYSPVEPSALIETARAHVTSKLESLAAELTSLQAWESDAPAWIRGELRVEASLRAALSAVLSEVMLLAPASDAARIRKMIDRRVRLQGRKLGEGFAILLDRKTALIGKFGPHASLLTTTQPAIVEIIAGAVPEAQLQRIAVVAEPGGFEASASWLGWEEEKHRRLLRH